MYPPLEMCKKMSLSELRKGSFTRTVRSLEGNETDAVLFLTYSKDLLNPEYNGKFKVVNDWLIKNRESMYKLMFGEDHPGFVEGTKADHDAAADCILPYLIANEWAKNKQIYAFDKELEEMLAGMEEIQVPVRILDRLPFREMYVQFAEDGIFWENFHGAFVKVMEAGRGYAIQVFRVGHDLMGMTGRIPIFPESEEAYSEEGAETEETGQAENQVFIINKDTDIDSTEKDSHIQYKQFCIFILNALLYLCSENAEVRESEITKQTYRPGKTIRNKFSEVRIHECGYVYGSMVRKQRIEKQEEKEDHAKTTKTRHSSSVRAHVRRAHWHHYRTGKGRKELTLRWIAPTPVGYGERLATIHKVVSEEEKEK